jgi:hypothetical protein
MCGRNGSMRYEMADKLASQNKKVPENPALTLNSKPQF